MTGQLIDIAGWIGATSLLAAYGLVSTSRLGGPGPVFQLLNLVGATGLLLNGVFHGAWPSAALNAVWLLVGLTALARQRPTPLPQSEH